jgi:hypothetical protein
MKRLKDDLLTTWAEQSPDLIEGLDVAERVVGAIELAAALAHLQARARLIEWAYTREAA